MINKVDTVDKDEILKAIDTYRKLYEFDEIIPCSALRNQNTEDIVPCILKYLPYGPMFYDEDTVTDQPQRQIAAEIIREKALHALDAEIPHGIAVAIDSMKERPGKKQPRRHRSNDHLRERLSQRNHYRQTGCHAQKDRQQCRYELERMLDAKVNLKIWVKVRKDWRDSDFMIKTLVTTRRNLINE